MSENFTRKSSNFLNMNQKILEVAFSLPLHTKELLSNLVSEALVTRRRVRSL